MEDYGKFELLTCLARGGMAEIFLARQRGEGRFERLVVIKRILPELADDERFVEMFLEEARIAALLEHPNVIPIYDLGRVEDTLFIAMPYVLGMTLQEMLEEATRLHRTIPLEIHCEIIRQALVGLHYAHERTGLDGEPLELVHRDVSPSNLIINDHGRVMLLDFGIATSSASSGGQTATLRGKLAYMSPEQVRAEKLDRRTDIFSLGVIFWELLVGKRLFQRKSDIEVINAITATPVQDPLEARPDLPELLAKVARRALCRDRNLRYASAAEMRADLERAAIEHGCRIEAPVLARFLTDNFGTTLKKQARTMQQARQIEATSEGPTRIDLPTSRSRTAPRPRRRWLIGIIVGAVLMALSLTAVLVARKLSLQRPTPEGPPLRFGMIPYLPEKVLAQEWSPLLRFLEQKVGRPVKLSMSESYEQMVDLLVTGKVDVADLSAYPFILARRRDPGIQPLAVGLTMNQKTYESYIVVPRTSAARRLADLKGSRICYVDRTSTSGYLMPRVMLRQEGFDPDHFFSSIHFSGDHYTAIKEMLSGRCDVATVASGSYVAANQVGIRTSRVRILVISPTLPHGAYCASSRVPKKLAQQLQRLLLDLDVKQEFGREALGNDLAITGFDPVDLTAFTELEREVQHLEDAARDGAVDISAEVDAGVDR